MTATTLIRLLIVLACSSACAGRARNPTIPISGDVSAVTPPNSGGYKGPFNNDDQGHADFCVKLTKPVVALRYADGTPSGFSLSPSILQPQAGSGVWCPENGLARLDAREIVTAADGSRMYFHRGGWGFSGNDPLSAVHYGHVRASDINTAGLRYFRSDSVSTLPAVPKGQFRPAPTEPWNGKGQQAGNGTPCSAPANLPLKVRVRTIPPDMSYLNSRQTGSIPYAIYGDPSEDLGPVSDRARGIRYTLLEWSWVNVRGGGVARALVPDGANFFPCLDVPSITLASVSDAQTKEHTGWVRAMYGAIRTGNGSLIYGWIVSAHRHAGHSVVRHLE